MSKSKKCPYQYSQKGIREETKTAKLLRDLYNLGQNLSETENDFVDEMLNKFFWSKIETRQISKLHTQIVVDKEVQEPTGTR